MQTRRFLMGLAIASALGAVAVLFAGFVWPPRSEPVFLNAGPLKDLPVEQARMFDVESPVTRWDVREATDRAIIGERATVTIVRHADGTVSAFLARDPRTGCPLRWRTDLPAHYGPGGFFRDPCHGSTYNGHGLRVFGPSPRYMDYFDASVNEQGNVIVDLRELHEGEVGPRVDARGTPTPMPPPQPTEPGGEP